MNKTKSGSLWEVLAGVRFLLAGLVMIIHSNRDTTQSYLIKQISEFGAFTAVLAFLVLSGFSIAHSYARSPKGFYGRRLLRIYPLYAVAVLLAAVVIIGAHEQPAVKVAKVVVGNLLFLQTYKFTPMLGNPVVWSLAVEATFYLLTPLLARMSNAQLLTLAAISAGAFAVYPKLHMDYYAWLDHGWSTLFLGWAWLGGFAFYRFRDKPVAGVLLASVMVTLSSINSAYNGRYSSVTLVVTALALVGGGGVSLPGVAKKVLVWLGDFSYPLYLFHAPAFLTCKFALHTERHVVVYAAAIAVTLVVATLDLMARKPLQRGWAVVETRTAVAAEYVLSLPMVRPVRSIATALPRSAGTAVQRLIAGNRAKLAVAN